MKYPIMINGGYTIEMYTLHEGVHKNVLPLFPITRFLRLASSTIYVIYGFCPSFDLIIRCQSVVTSQSYYHLLHEWSFAPLTTGESEAILDWSGSGLGIEVDT